jgi:hypothetical protein
LKRLLLLVAACGGTNGPPSTVTETPRAIDAGVVDSAVAVAIDAAAVEPPPVVPEEWLKGSTHVHARPSGDSGTSIPDVIAWYETRGYAFIVLTDHNKISQVEPEKDTAGQVHVRAPEKGLIVLAGTELTSNPKDCTPKHHPTGNCRIHANLLGVTARPAGKIAWWNKTSTKVRVNLYTSALEAQKTLGGIAQLNHPNWFWGMSSDELIELVQRGFTHFEVANAQQKSWNRGSGARHPSTEEMWDAVLAKGLTLWGLATDDAHHYNDKGLYPAGGGWIMVRARRDPKAIYDAIAAGRFYSSNGVELVRAEVVGDELVIDTAPGKHTIEFIEAGKVVAKVDGPNARRAIPGTGYVRAVVTRADGAKAWVQPARR